MKHNPYKIVQMFEEEVAEYAGSSFAVAIDNCTDALFLSCIYEKVTEVEIPTKTYLSVPQAIMAAGGKVNFREEDWKGIYQLNPYPIYDAARRFTKDMYIPGSFMCLSFHPKKILKMRKGGMILTDNVEAYKWFKKARFSGRDECSYHIDDFDLNPVIGWNFYMMPEIATRGVLLMSGFYKDGIAKQNEDLELSYPDLSKFEIWK
jgi:dTDP-4-amino-4,6-dideoxygalactose transaminase